MTQKLAHDIHNMHKMLMSREGGRGDLATALRANRRRLPRRVYRQGIKIAHAVPLLQHPHLQLTLDLDDLRGAVREVTAHLKSINMADRRLGRMLDIGGSLAFSLVSLGVLIVVVLRWRGFV